MTRFVAAIQALKGDPDQARPNSRVEWLDPVGGITSLCLPIMPSERSADGDRRAK
jgi:hypothetical protein